MGENGRVQLRKVPGGKGAEISLAFDGGTKRFVFVLKGKPALGIEPEFVVLMDDKEVYKTTIKSTEWKEYSFTCTPEPGTHKVVLKHTNDYYNPETREGRNMKYLYTRISDNLHRRISKKESCFKWVS